MDEWSLLWAPATSRSVLDPPGLPTQGICFVILHFFQHPQLLPLWPQHTNMSYSRPQKASSGPYVIPTPCLISLFSQTLLKGRIYSLPPFPFFLVSLKPSPIKWPSPPLVSVTRTSSVPNAAVSPQPSSSLTSHPHLILVLVLSSGKLCSWLLEPTLIGYLAGYFSFSFLGPSSEAILWSGKLP